MTDGNHFAILEQLATGTPLRDAVNLIMQQETGGLVVLGNGTALQAITSGGFRFVGAEFAPQRLAELAKMDGAIIVTEAADFIVAANVQLNPDTDIKTNETGMRQRTAERVASQTGQAVIAVSEGRESATVYVEDSRYELQNATNLLAQANQSMMSLERFRRQLSESEDQLAKAEVAGTAVVRDVVRVFQRAGLVLHVGEELDRSTVELGEEGQLLRLQIADLVADVDRLLELIYRDYSRSRARAPKPLEALRTLPLSELEDQSVVASVADLGSMDSAVSPRGLRALAGVPRLPDSIEAAVLGRFDGLTSMLEAAESEFAKIEGIGRSRARQLRHYFDRMLELAPHLMEDD